MNIVITDLQKAETFSTLFQHVKLFSEHVNIMFDKDKMYLQAMDSSRVSIFEINIPSKWFDTYSHTNEANICIGINTNVLFKILNTRDKSQILSIQFDTNDNDTLFIKFTSETKNVFDKQFQVPLMEIDSELMQIPDMDYAVEFTLPSTNFASVINQLKLFGDSLDIECSEEKIILHSSTVESGKMSVEMNIDDLNSYAINEGNTIKSSFGLSFLHNICMYNKIAKTIEISLYENYPMKIIYRLDESDENAKITYYLAPKINDE